MKHRACMTALLAALSFPAFADDACDAKTTTGQWVFKCEGELPTPAPTQLRSLGTCDASRYGYFRCTGTANLGGTIIPQSLQGQANNHGDCTGTIRYEQILGGQPGPPLDITYVIHDNGDEIWGLPLNSGGVMSCRLRRMSKTG